MAIVSKDNRDGVDVVVEYLQQFIYPRLLGFWEAGSVYTSYPRANKNYKKDGNDETLNIIPEISLDEKDYNESLFDDRVSLTSFWLVDDAREYNSDNDVYEHEISILFQAQLTDLYSIDERADEIFIQDVLRVLRVQNPFIIDGFTVTTGVDNVYSDLSLSGALKEQINLSDISERHVSKFTFTVRYGINCAKTINTVCAPATINVNDIYFDDVPSGAVYNIEVVDPQGNTIPIQVIDNQVVVDCQPTGTTDIIVNGLTMFTGLVSGDTYTANGLIMKTV